MKKILLLICFVLPLPLMSSSLLQNSGLFPKQSIISRVSSKKFDPSKLTYGGNFWLQFGTYTYFDISPMVGYYVTDRLVPGVGLSYTYLQQRFPGSFTNKSSLYGIRGFLRYDILDYVFVYGEYELLNWDYYDFFAASNVRKWSGTPIIGGGLRQDGGNIDFLVYALYAFGTDNPESPYYQRPLLFRVGIMFN